MTDESVELEQLLCLIAFLSSSDKVSKTHSPLTLWHADGEDVLFSSSPCCCWWWNVLPFPRKTDQTSWKWQETLCFKKLSPLFVEATNDWNYIFRFRCMRPVDASSCGLSGAADVPLLALYYESFPTAPTGPCKPHVFSALSSFLVCLFLNFFLRNSFCPLGWHTK